jgi:hypothetical protein
MIKLKDLISEKKNPFHPESPAYEPWEKKHGKKKKNEGGPGSGPHGDDDNPFDREPSDDELKDIEKQFEGKLDESMGFFAAMAVGKLMVLLAKWAQRNPKYVNQLKTFVNKKL